MREYVSYLKEKRKELVSISAIFLLLGISGVVLLPHVMEQWSHDRTIGVLHVITGLVLGGCGITGLIILVKNLHEKCQKKWKNKLLPVILWYLAIQVLSGIIQGLLGLLLYRFDILSYETTKEVLYIVDGIFQNCIRVWFLFLLAEIFYSRNWKNDLAIGRKALLMGLALCFVTVILSLTNAGAGMSVIKVLWEVIYISGFLAYFGMMLRREK